MRQQSPAVLPAGFTLIELLVVIAIIGILVALLLPAVQAHDACSAATTSSRLGLPCTTTPRPTPRFLRVFAFSAALASGASFKLRPDTNQNTGHTEWADGRVHHSGITTVFTPNTVVSYVHTDGHTYDVDYNSRQEGQSVTQPTYAAVTVRSYHPGGVNVLLMDGSVRTVGNSIELAVWRALGTRAGGEVPREY